MTNPKIALCFGEILWDFLPSGLFLGGAPLNVAYHLHRLGETAVTVSSVGCDVLGDEVIRRLEHWGLPTQAVGRDFTHPTGYVRASLNEKGDARYEFAANVAWDTIAIDQTIETAARSAAAIVFGSLAQRTTANRAALDRLLKALPAEAWRIFDVNLRPPFDDLGRVAELMPRCNVLKLNAAEAALIAANESEAPGREELHARILAARSKCRLICITAGERGAGLLHDGDWVWQGGHAVNVADTIGSGDAFLAALTAQLMRGTSDLATMLERACRLGEWVATRPGATPPYDATTPKL